VLCGGFGAARFVDGLGARGSELQCIVNVGDDFDYLGLRVCPDLDSVLYALAGSFDERRGWGPLDDSFACNEALGRYGDDWFHLGDRDLALTLVRTARLGAGEALSAVTRRLVEAWNVAATVLPVSDDPVRTNVRTSQGWMGFQEFVVREGAQPLVAEVGFDGAEHARPAPGVLVAVETADVVVVAPSNPITSIAPILAVPGLRQAIAERDRPTVAVSPIVLGADPATEAERARATRRAVFMSALGLAHRPSVVAATYRGLIDGFVLDERDLETEGSALAELGLPVLTADTLAPPGRRTELADRVLAFGAGLPLGRRHEWR